MNDKPIYLDYAATTPCDRRVVEAMTSCFSGTFGNPACTHVYGVEACDAVERAREQTADLIGAMPDEIIFTAGASESNNLAIKGVSREGRRHVITSSIEHKAVLQPCRQLGEDGYDVTFLEPGPDGMITVHDVAAALRDDTLLVSLMGVNNEIGTMTDLAAIGQLCRSREVLFHSDATQMIGTMPIDVTCIDLLSWSGHKIYGPKGVGALYVRDGIELRPVIAGGGHEGGRRAGTLNVPGIVGLGVACVIVTEERDRQATRLSDLRERLEAGLRERVDDLIINGEAGVRAPHVANLCFPSVAGTRLIDEVTGIACTSGAAACGTISHVLAALGIDEDVAVTSLRLSLGGSTSAAHIDTAIDLIASAVDARATRPATP